LIELSAGLENQQIIFKRRTKLQKVVKSTPKICRFETKQRRKSALGVLNLKNKKKYARNLKNANGNKAEKGEMAY